MGTGVLLTTCTQKSNLSNHPLPPFEKTDGIRAGLFLSFKALAFKSVCMNDASSRRLAISVKD